MSLPKLSPKLNALGVNNAPISQAEFAKLMQDRGLSAEIPLAVAVSGGADSMALLLLTRSWSKNPLTALTVDHGLRKESTAEAAQVKEWCKSLGVLHHTLTWQHHSPTTGIQNKARDARYELMLGWLRAHRMKHLLAAHHLNDQMETLFFRLARGSGLEGLQGMKPTQYRQGIFIHRPLLSAPHSRLVETLKQANHPWLEDPSNHDSRFTRIHLRKQILSVDKSVYNNFSHLTETLNNFYNLLEYKLVESLIDCFSFCELGYGWLQDFPFKSHPYELQKRLLIFILHTISGDASPIRTDALERIFQQIVAFKKFTFHGCIFTFHPKEKRWLIYREHKAISPALSLTKNPQLWDGRFVASTTQQGLTIKALGQRQPPALREALLNSQIPKAAWPSLPAFYRLEECVFVPHISYQHPSLDEAPEIAFCPTKLLADGWFFGMNTPT